MSAGFLTSETEWLELRSVDHIARDLYMALRRRMDFSTGVVGGSRCGISWHALREDCEVPGRPGVRAFRPTEQQLRRRAEQLEKLGLIRRISVGLVLKFRMLIAKTDLSAQKKAEGGARGQKKPAKPDGEPKHGQRPKRTVPKAGTHPEPGKPTHSSSPPLAAMTDEEGSETPPTENSVASTSEAGAQHRHRPSEQRDCGARSVGGGPAGQLAEGGNSEPPWSPILAWPARIPVHERAAVAYQLSALVHAVRQRVLDEWDGAVATGKIAQPWRFFETVVARALSPGWLPDHADAVAARRQQARQVERALQQQKAMAVSCRGTPGAGAAAIASVKALLKRGRTK